MGTGVLLGLRGRIRAGQQPIPPAPTSCKPEPRRTWRVPAEVLLLSHHVAGSILDRAVTFWCGRLPHPRWSHPALGAARGAPAAPTCTSPRLTSESGQASPSRRLRHHLPRGPIARRCSPGRQLDSAGHLGQSVTLATGPASVLADDQQTVQVWGETRAVAARSRRCRSSLLGSANAGLSDSPRSPASATGGRDRWLSAYRPRCPRARAGFAAPHRHPCP